LNYIKLTQKQLKAFEEDGFFVIQDALNEEQIKRLTKAGDRLAESFLNQLQVLNKPGYNDLDLRSDILLESDLYNLIFHSTTVPLVVQLLGSNIHLHSTALIYKRPEDPNLPAFRRGWHRDMRMPKDLGYQSLPRVGIKICYCLTDFQESAGMTLMARGSHLSNKPLTILKGQIDPSDFEVCEVKLNAGDALLFENRIFHTANLNRSKQVSKRIMYGYAYRWMRPELYLDPPDEQLLDKAKDSITRQLLGGYRDMDTPPLALQEWSKLNGVWVEPVPWVIKVENK
jgi:ectoine hydroxylase-related dioxygenase (phytanoyl-CoA dioxygenase family)